MMDQLSRRARNTFLIGCLLLLLSAVGCGNSEQKAPPAAPDRPRPTLRIGLGLLPEQNIFFQKKRYQAVFDYLARHLEADFELEILSRHGNILDNFRKQNLDGAFFGSFSGMRALQILDLEPVARPVRLDGESSYRGLIIARKDGRIKDAAATRGKVFVFVEKGATAGWLFPLYVFRQLGIKDYHSWFGKTYYSGTHEDAILDVLAGRADLGATKSIIFQQLAAADSRVRDELVILETSEEVPAYSLAIRKDLAQPLKDQLRRLLLTMHENPEGKLALKEFEALRFVETRVEDYKPVSHYARDIGLNLLSYEDSVR